jgi:hypothetical protein
VADGSARARQPVMTGLLRELGVAVELPDGPVLGHGRPVGSVTAAPLRPAP